MFIGEVNVIVCKIGFVTCIQMRSRQLWKLCPVCNVPVCFCGNVLLFMKVNSGQEHFGRKHLQRWQLRVKEGRDFNFRDVMSYLWLFSTDTVSVPFCESSNILFTMVLSWIKRSVPLWFYSYMMQTVWIEVAHTHSALIKQQHRPSRTGFRFPGVQWTILSSSSSFYFSSHG